MGSLYSFVGGVSLKEIKTKPEGGKPKVLDSVAKMPKAAMKDLWLKSKEKTMAEVKDTPFLGQKGETANTPANHAEDRMLSGIETSVKKGVNLTYRGGKKLAQTTARKIRKKREVSRNLSEIKSTNRKVISEPQNIGGKNTQSIHKTASTIRSKNPASKVIKGKPQKAVKTVNRSVKGVKQGTKSIKTAQRSAKAAHKTAQATAKAAQKTAQAAKAAGKITAAGVKTAVRAAVAAVKATIVTSKSLIAAIAAGGWVVVVVVLLICIIGMAVNSIFGIFAPSPGSGNNNTIQSAMEEINQQYQDNLANIRENAVYNEVDLRGSPAPWKEVLAVYTVKNNTDPDQPPSFIEMDGAAKKELSEVFWDMTEISHTTKQQEVQEIEISDDGNGNLTETETTVTKTFLIITVKSKTPESLSEVYGFSDKQKEYLSELLSPSFDSFWQGILTNVPSSSTDLVEIAQSQLGNVGGEPYWSWYGFDSRVEWCACFVSWCANQAGMLENGELPKFASCNSQGVPWFQERGRWKNCSYTPSPGDIIFFDWDADEKADHVGIVEKVENETIFTIEGNSNDTCQRNSYSMGSEIILGFGK